jgi:hypothetical protein
VQLVRGPLVLSLFVGDRADERDVLHRLGGLLPAVGDLNSRSGRANGRSLSAVFRSRFGIEGLELAGAALHPQEDHGATLFAKLLGVHAHQLAKVERAGEERPGRDVLQEAPP